MSEYLNECVRCGAAQGEDGDYRLMLGIGDGDVVITAYESYCAEHLIEHDALELASGDWAP